MPRPGYDPAARARLLQRKVKGEHFLHLPADFIHIEYFLLINKPASFLPPSHNFSA